MLTYYTKVVNMPNIIFTKHHHVSIVIVSRLARCHGHVAQSNVVHPHRATVWL